MRPTEGIRTTRLGNGVRIASDAAPDLRSVSVGLWVETGSRYESDPQAGLSHFLEHLFFKGTERRSALAIAQEIESLGGVLNAFTGKEQTCYYAKVLPEHLPIALDVLGDVFTRSTFPDDDIERERTVIAQEIMQSEDTPEEHVHDLFGMAFWPEHPLARPIAGSVDSIARFSRNDFVDFMRERYGPDRVLVTAAGALDHDALVAGVEAHLGGLAGTTDPVALHPPVPQGGRFETEGLRCKVAVRDRTSKEKVDALRAVGVEVVVVDGSLPPEHPDSYNRVMERIVRETPGCYFPDQHNNRKNNEAHYRTTGPELWESLSSCWRSQPLRAPAGRSLPNSAWRKPLLPVPPTTATALTPSPTWIRIENSGDEPLHGLQLTDELAVTFAGATGFHVSSVSSTSFTWNPAFDVATDQNLLAGSDSLAIGLGGVVDVTVTVTPGRQPGSVRQQCDGERDERRRCLALGCVDGGCARR